MSIGRHSQIASRPTTPPDALRRRQPRAIVPTGEPSEQERHRGEVPQRLAAAGAPKEVPPPSSPTELLKHIHVSQGLAMRATVEMLKLAREQATNPEMRTIQINGATGIYQVQDRSQGFPARSLGIYNPSDYTIYIGVAGLPATAQALVPTVPPGAAVTLPIQATDLTLGADATALGENTALFYLFRYPTVQPLRLS